MVKGYANEEQSKPMDIAAFSPEDDSSTGEIILIVGSDLPSEIIGRIFNSIHVEVL
ncbi:MAG: hypothetical protein MUO26_08265 [Methanotrichaceae archaeon]|nr:hypothetical protein [Methanotrichaceae archaeon]